MKRKRRQTHWYAAYRGDRYIFAGTLDELSEHLGKKRETVRWYAQPVYHKRMKDYERTLLVYKYENDEGDTA